MPTTMRHTDEMYAVGWLAAMQSRGRRLELLRRELRYCPSAGPGRRLASRPHDLQWVPVRA